MKVIDSGMPEEKLWNSFFNVNLILEKLEIDKNVENILEIGCGYGTFTIQMANSIKGNIFALDIEDSSIQNVNQKAENNKIRNIITLKADILDNYNDMTTLINKKENTIDYVCLFNILHHYSPNDFLDIAYKVLEVNGKVGIIHWRTDIETPRGPNMKIRPNSNKIKAILDKSKFEVYKDEILLEPYHWGMILQKI